MAVKETTREGAPRSTTVVARRSLPEITQAFAAMVAAIPDAGEDDTGLAIAGRLLNAESPDQLNVIGELPSAEDVADRVIVVTGLTRRPSDFEGPLGIYLVVDAVDASTGEVLRFGVGATGVVAALAKAHFSGWLPLRCEIKRSPKATKAGYYPLNLRVYGDSTSF